MKKIIITLASAIVALICLFCTAGCKAPYNAEIVCDSYDNAGEWINEDFKIKNGVIPLGEAATADCPKSRTFVIKSEEEKLNVLNGDFDVEVNFEQEMLILYTWSSEYRKPCYIKRMELKNGVLYIYYDIPLPPLTGCACPPYQRWVVIKSDLLSMSSVEIKEI